MDLRNGIARRKLLRRSGSRSAVGCPAIVLRAHRYSPLSVVTVSSCETSSPCPRANPSAALVGWPFSSKAAFLAGPIFSTTWSSCFGARSAMCSTSRRGVARQRMPSKAIRFSESALRIISSISTTALDKNPAGISSVPISKRSSLLIVSPEVLLVL